MVLIFRLGAALALAIVAVTILVAVAAWEQLPSHVALAGRRLTMSRGELIAPGVIMGATTLLLIPLALVLPRWPRQVNIPGIEPWRELPLDARQRSFAAVRAWHAVLACALACTAPLITWAQWQKALGRDSALLHVGLIAMPLVPLILGFTVFFPRFEADVAEETRRQSSA